MIPANTAANLGTVGDPATAFPWELVGEGADPVDDAAGSPLLGFASFAEPPSVLMMT